MQQILHSFTPVRCLHCVHLVILWWGWFSLTSARVHPRSRGGIRHTVLSPAFLCGFSWHCQRCLSGLKPAAWQNTLPSTTCGLNTPTPPPRHPNASPSPSPLKNNYHCAKTASDESTFSWLLGSSRASLHGQRTQGATRREDRLLNTSAGALPLSDSWSTAAKANKAPFSPVSPPVL